jgi:hypothetical protein
MVGYSYVHGTKITARGLDFRSWLKRAQALSDATQSAFADASLGTGAAAGGTARSHPGRGGSGGALVAGDRRRSAVARSAARGGSEASADDGGLSAILGVVTVKLHADTVRDLIAAKIEAAPIPSEEKSALRKHLGALPETVLRAATTDLVRAGLNNLPDAIHWFRRS